MLSDAKRAEIFDLYARDANITKVARDAGVDRKTVRKVLSGHKPMKPGRKRQLSDRQLNLMRRSIIKKVRGRHRVIAQIVKNDSKLDCSLRTIQRGLKSKSVTYENTPKKLPLTACHKQKRVAFATEHIGKKTNFKEWIFSDEKRFSMDGPDSFGSYGYGDVRLPRVKRQQVGGGVMTLGAICNNGKMLIKIS